ncbi:two-component system connector SafA [Escherichia coli]|nr:two-component system connector SafA [Escherichia coli]
MLQAIKLAARDLTHFIINSLQD